MEEEIELDELHGDYRSFEQGKMVLLHAHDGSLSEVKVELNYDNGDYWGTIKKHYKIGDTVQILDSAINDIGGVIESFIRYNGNVIKVKLVNRQRTFLLIDCFKK